MTSPEPGSAEWLALVKEPILEPELRIVDPHHHLWQRAQSTYVLEDLWSDTESGHNVDKTVFVECHAGYLEDGPEHLRPVGETRFVKAIADESTKGPGARIAGIVSHTDLRSSDTLEEVLAAHAEAGQGLFRGIRHAGSHAKHPESLRIPGRAPAGLYADEAFRNGVRTLGRLGYTYETWHYHYQNTEFADLVRSAPDTTIILDHFGTPLGVGPYAGQRESIFEQWKKDIAEIAKSPNVYAKLGGLAMPDCGFGWEKRALPPTSDEFFEAQRPYYLHAIESFGPERCMFESNFPVDKFAIGYAVMWNGIKKIVADFPADEKVAMFAGIAEKVYKI